MDHVSAERGSGRPRLLSAAAIALSLLGITSLALASTHHQDLPPRPPGGARSAAGAQPSPTSPPSQRVRPLSESPPTALSIPSIGVRTALIRLGLQPDGTLQVPLGPTPAGWYVLSPTPGQTGASVIAGHVTYNGARGVFFSLARLRPGDRVDVRRVDGRTADFRVYAVRSYPKQTFPTRAVYGRTPDPELRLITCGGDYDPLHHRYADNLIVFARLTGTIN